MEGGIVRCDSCDTSEGLASIPQKQKRRTESIAICERRTASGNEFQSVMVRGNNEYFKASVRTGNDINLFSLEALVCRDETTEPAKGHQGRSWPGGGPGVRTPPRC